MDPRQLEDWLALHLLPGLGPVTAQRALERYQEPGAIAYGLSPERLATCGRVDGAALLEGRKSLRRRAARELRLARAHGVRVLPCAHPDYPAALAEVPARPVVVFQQGRLDPGVLRVAVIGSRTPTAYGRHVATGLADGLAARGVEVVSGGARGIDSAAHRAALGAGGRTVAVLGSGLLRPYPPENERLFAEVAKSGCLISELALEEPPRKEHFPRRNRLISGLAAAVVVVEAAERSGALSTAGHALDQGREVLAVPGPVQSAKSAGCHRLIQQGAKLLQNIEDILEELPPLYRTDQPCRPAGDAAGETPAATDDERAVLGILGRTEPVHLDRLADTVPFGIARLQTALFGLELRGAVEQTPGRYYVLRPKKEP